METGETVGRKIALILVRADGGLDQGGSCEEVKI